MFIESLEPKYQNRFMPTLQSELAKIQKPLSARNDFSPDYLKFFSTLNKAFESQRQILLQERAAVLNKAHKGEMPGYLTKSEAQTGDWRVTLPSWAMDQRNQITGPADNAKMLIGMCNSGAPGCMADGEDSIVGDWEHVRAAQFNTIAATEFC